jgi:hypothetical protein
MTEHSKQSNPASKENPSTIHHRISAAEKHSLQILMKEDVDEISKKKKQKKQNRAEQEHF